MALVIPPGFAQVAWRFALEGDPEVQVFTCGADVGSFGGDFNAAAAALSVAFETNWGSSGWGDDWRYLGTVLRVGQDGGPPLIAEFTASIQGTSTSARLPSNCAVLVRKTSNRGGRTGRGRMYLPACVVGEGLVDGNGLLSSTYLSDAQALADAWFADFEPVLLHTTGVPGGTDPTPVTSFIVDRRIATQRRRMRP